MLVRSCVIAVENQAAALVFIVAGRRWYTAKRWRMELNLMELEFHDYIRFAEQSLSVYVAVVRHQARKWFICRMLTRRLAVQQISTNTFSISIPEHVKASTSGSNQQS